MAPRMLTASAIHAATITLTVVLALRASDPVIAVLAIAAVAILLGWFAALSSSTHRSGLNAIGVLNGLPLSLVGRAPWGELLPVTAVQAVTGVAVGAGAGALSDRLGPTLVMGTPGLLTTVVVALTTGIITAWATLAIDGGAPTALIGLPAVFAGATGPIILISAFHPATALALATADLLPWDTAASAISAALAGAVIGTYGVSALLPPGPAKV